MNEIGYAFTTGKQVIPITDRNGEKFPFAIQYRTIIIEYSREATQDLSGLRLQLATKAKALLAQEAAAKVVAGIPSDRSCRCIFRSEQIAIPGRRR